MTNPSTAESAASRTFPCPGCGATVEFAPGTAVLRCPRCGHQQAVAAVPGQARKHPFEELAMLPAWPQPARGNPGAAHSFRCPNCHARTESDSLSVRCQFCATPLVAEAAAAQRITPDAVVPFALDRDAARRALRAWTSSRWLAPAGLKKVTEAETVKGSYLPHWAYDARTVSQYRGDRGEHYLEVEAYARTENGETRTETREVQRTRWWPASGTVARNFSDVLVPGTTKLAADQLDRLGPWPLELARPYQAEFLAGFQTVCYDIEPEAGLETAKKKMAEVIEADCRADIGGDEQRVASVATTFSAVAYELMLLPVWVMSYLHAGRSWQVMVNAHTGEVTGERPYSKAKILMVLLVVAAVIAGVVLLTRSAHHHR
jgi:DNA-directed RNA polymerase subunit RPC12/RpoP